MARFTWNPSFGAQAAREPRIRSAKFGDGYEQRAAVGLNADLAMWSLTFENRSDADAASITAFLAARGGHEAFEWIAPGDTVTVTDHGFGVGDGTTTAFQLQATKNREWSDVLGTWPVYTKPRTNLLSYSEQIDNAWWTKFQCSATPNAATAPNGSSAADRITEATAASTPHWVRRTLSLTAGTRYTTSVYAKAGERTAVWVRAGAGSAFFNLAAGTLITTLGTGATGGIEALPNGWYRCWCSCVAPTTGSDYAGFGLMNGTAAANNSYTGDGVSGAFFWGAQFETGVDAPTSYIPTTSAAVTVNPSYWPASGDGFEPITEAAPGITIYKNGVALVQGTDWTLGASGVVTFSVAPASGAVLSWTGTGSWVKSWICRKWSRRVPNYGVASISTDFEQVPA